MFDHGSGGSVLAGAVLNGCTLREIDLSSSDLHGVSWSGGQLERVNLDRANLSDALFRDVEFAEITLDQAVLSGCRFESGTHVDQRIVGAIWYVGATGENLLVVGHDGRVVAIDPHSRTVSPLNLEVLATGSPQALAGFLLALRGQANIGFDEVTFARSGWQFGKDWRNGSLDDGLAISYDVSMIGPPYDQDIERLSLRVTSASTKEPVLSLQVEDRSAFDYSTATYTPRYEGQRVLCFGRRGTWVALIDGIVGEEETAIIRGSSHTLPLHGFVGSKFRRGAETTDGRGAAASPRDAVLAICERPNVIGFWRTDSGALMGRAISNNSVEGPTPDVGSGATITGLVRGARYGWRFESQ
jgi:hypothetical protein